MHHGAVSRRRQVYTVSGGAPYRPRRPAGGRLRAVGRTGYEQRFAVLRRGALEQVGVDRGVDAGAAAAVGGVAVAVVGEQAGGGELAGQGLGPGYGVAGSRVVPTTTIGAAPFASMRCGSPVALTGQYAQFREAQARPSPKTGDAFSKSGSACSHLVRGVEGGREVEAVHGRVGEHQVGVVAVGVALVVAVGEDEQSGAVVPFFAEVAPRAAAARRSRRTWRRSRRWWRATRSSLRPSASPVGRGLASSFVEEGLRFRPACSAVSRAERAVRLLRRSPRRTT